MQEILNKWTSACGQGPKFCAACMQNLVLPTRQGSVCVCPYHPTRYRRHPETCWVNSEWTTTVGFRNTTSRLFCVILFRPDILCFEFPSASVEFLQQDRKRAFKTDCPSQFGPRRKDCPPHLYWIPKDCFPTPFWHGISHCHPCSAWLDEWRPHPSPALVSLKLESDFFQIIATMPSIRVLAAPGVAIVQLMSAHMLQQKLGFQTFLLLHHRAPPDSVWPAQTRMFVRTWASGYPHRIVIWLITRLTSSPLHFTWKAVYSYTRMQNISNALTFLQEAKAKN